MIPECFFQPKTWWQCHKHQERYSVKIRRFLLTVFLAACLTVPAGAAFAVDVAEQADVIYKAITAGEAIPISSVPEDEQTEGNAYLIQEILHKKMMQTTKDTVVGFKAGLTAEPQLKRFKAPGAASAPLFKSGLIVVKAPKKSVTIKSFPGIMLETEFAFRTAKAIKSPVGSIDELRPLIKSVHACIEIPRIRFTDMPKLFFFDLTASGVGTKMFMVGPAHDPQNMDLDGAEVTLVRDGETVNTGKGADALGSQWKALLWLVNNVVARNGGIEKGQYLLTGAMGAMIPGKNGSYTATFPFETLKFTVSEK